jgi:hypothetical protein
MTNPYEKVQSTATFIYSYNKLPRGGRPGEVAVLTDDPKHPSLWFFDSGVDRWIPVDIPCMGRRCKNFKEKK